MPKCKHLNRRNIHGDEIIQAMSVKKMRRQRCTDCDKALNESVDPKGLAVGNFMDTTALINEIDDILDEV